jgi:trehalose 6-phosphate synthase/phosphatase
LETGHKGLVLVSNRIPISFETKDGELTGAPSSGGLISALEPLLRQNGGTWVGSVSTEEHPRVHELLAEATRGQSFTYAPLFLTKEEQTNFYEGFSNEVIWPLFHDLQSRCKFDPEYWNYYLGVNKRFAAAVNEVAKPGDLVWIHDYQMMEVAKALRSHQPAAKCAFFLHIPFPGPDIFEKLPWRKALLEGLLKHDLLGFQTGRDERNFIACVRHFLPESEITGRGDTRTVLRGNRHTSVGFFPISIDFEEYSKAAAQAAVRDQVSKIRHEFKGVKIALGVDRLDYTKGIPERIRAFGYLLRNYPDLRKKVGLIQLAVPSRENIPEYQDLKAEIEGHVARVNGEFSEPGWAPITYMHRSVPREELLALYGAADVALITPLKDGMNLVAKEYCSAKVESDGALVLSEFAGAAPELGSAALLVNPYDEIGTAAALARAFSMPLDEQRRRMLRMRRQIRHFDITAWRDRIFSAIEQA